MERMIKMFRIEGNDAERLTTLPILSLRVWPGKIVRSVLKLNGIDSVLPRFSKGQGAT